MAKSYGTLALFDAAVADTAVEEFGEQRAFEVLQADLAAHNRAVNEMLADFAVITSDQQRVFGSATKGEMVRADEFAAPEAQRHQESSYAVGFPLYLNQYGLQWTKLWLQTHSLRDLEKEYMAGRTADIQGIHRDIRSAIFLPTNNTGYVDRRSADRLPYSLYALLNADSQPIPHGPNFETFDGATHTHYLTTNNASVTAAAAKALIEHVVEHGHQGGGRVLVYINRAEEGDKDTAGSGWRALPGFAPYTDVRVITPSDQEVARGNLTFNNLYNRPIGIYNGAEVWVKSWIPAGYAFAFDAASPAKPLAFRVRAGTNLGELQIAAEWDQYPLRAQNMEREHGVGVWTRSNGAVLQKVVGTTYTAPTLSLIG